tara:strand:- start:1037 stop:1234 length:198 start_codon:yes stop_codon:yes gene_type:complete
MINKFLEKYIIGKMFKSRKFWYTIVGIITTFLSNTFGLNPEEVNNILMSIAALVVGQGIADSSKK